MIGDCGRDVVVDRLDREAVGEVDVLPVEALEQRRGPGQARVCSSPCAAPFGRAHGARDPREARARRRPRRCAEEQLHADADAEHGPPCSRALADRLVEADACESSRGALDVADSRDHGERCFSDRRGVDSDRRLGSGAGERRGDRAQIAGAVIGAARPSRDPLGRADPAAARRDRLLSAWPSALNAASATW